MKTAKKKTVLIEGLSRIMNMKIKTKLYAGLGFLAFLIVVLWASSLIFINELAENSSAIIRHNSHSVTYMEKMQQSLKALHSGQTTGIAKRDITQTATADSLKEHLLTLMGKQLENITEEREGELSRRLQDALLRYFDLIEQRPDLNAAISEDIQALVLQYGIIQRLMSEITFINLKAMSRKNNIAQQTASNVILYMTIIGGISVLFALGLLVRYPNYIVSPIRELIDRIKQIADQNYDQKLDFETGDEYEELGDAFNTMARRLREYDSSNMVKLMDRNRRIEAIINHMSEAIVGLDKDKNILFINDKAEELIGMNRTALVGAYAPDIASTNDLMRKLIQNLMDENKAAGKNGEADLIKIASGNDQIYYSKETLPILDSSNGQYDKKRNGTIITLKNVTRFQELNEAKTDFVAIVSHELKTPIASINMSLRLLKDERVGRLNHEQNKLLADINNDARRMRETISDLLDISKIEIGNIQLSTRPARPIDLIKYAYDTMKQQAEEQNVQIEMHCDEQLPEVKTDLQKTEWVLVNLISNALRYTPFEGTIRLDVKVDEASVIFSVSDSGQGIPDEYIDKIFQKYFQVHGNSIKNGGSGLGLAIAKEFITAQGGEINVKSELGEGSTFYFTLPKIK